jgi:methylmalonyl-CoA mutase C-terminal domain/subunit
VEDGSRSTRQYKVIVAKPGLDGHDRGAKIVARALRDAGFEVIYLGLFQTPQAIAQAAVQEDADAIGLSLLSGAHLTLFADLMAELEALGVSDTMVFGGGIIPEQDIASLKALGVAELFTPGASTETITSWLRDRLDAREAAS